MSEAVAKLERGQADLVDPGEVGITVDVDVKTAECNFIWNSLGF